MGKLTESDFIRIIFAEEIKTASNGNKYRKVKLRYRDITTWYHAYEDSNPGIWKSVEKDTYRNDLFNGEIIEIDVDEQLLTNVLADTGSKISDYRTAKKFPVVIWNIAEFQPPTDQKKIEYFLKKQLWKLNKKYSGD